MSNDLWEHVMIDIETLGGSPNGALMQIGACPFSLETGEVGEPWVVNVSVKDAVKRGMQIDVSTVGFWMGQPEAWATLQNDKQELGKALEMLRLGYNWSKLEGVWTNAPLFDFAIMRRAYELVGCKAPWHYRQERCSRTLFYLARQIGEVALPARSGIHHNAGDDARFQAQFAVILFEAIRNGGREVER